MLSWVHVVEWRAAATPEAVALTGHEGAEPTYAGLLGSALREPFSAGRDRRVS